MDSEYCARLKFRYSDSERSSSPTASSGLECVSMKDSPMMQLDNDTMSEAGSLVSDMFDSHHRSFSASSKFEIEQGRLRLGCTKCSFTGRF